MKASLVLVRTLTACARDLRGVPLAVGPATDGGRVSLDEAPLAVVAEQSVDLVARLQGPEHPGVPHRGGGPARHWRQRADGPLIDPTDTENPLPFCETLMQHSVLGGAFKDNSGTLYDAHVCTRCMLGHVFHVSGADLPVPFLQVKVRW